MRQAKARVVVEAERTTVREHLTPACNAGMAY